MDKICQYWGKKITFLNSSFESAYKELSNFTLCEVCSNNYYKYKNGEISLEKHISDNTDQQYKDFLSSAHLVSEIKHKEEVTNTKEQAREVSPLYDDIHQMADDIHFIKNIVLVGVILSVVGVLLSIVM